MKKYLAAALVILTLGAGAYYATRKAEESPKETQAGTIQEKIALVNSISNLSDDPALIDEADEHRAAGNIAALKAEQNKLGLYQGILSKCYLSGHDVHWVNENGVLDHVSSETPLTGDALKARNMIYERGGGTVVVIYEKGHAAYGMDGNLIK